MQIQYNNKKIGEILDSFYNLTNINMAIVDTKFNYLYTSGTDHEFCSIIQRTSQGNEKCLCSDFNMLKKSTEKKCFFSHKCHAGITDSVIPIIKDYTLVGYVFIGRVRQEKDFDKIYSNISWIDIDKEKMEKAYKKLPTLSDLQLRSLADLLSHIVFENAITIEGNNFESKITSYIEENLDKKISINELCKVMHMTKNILYKNFHDTFGCSIIDYIINKRIKKAQMLILQTDDKINYISEKIGINNYTYFCKLFKKRTGFSPKEYRKNKSKNRD